MLTKYSKVAWVGIIRQGGITYTDTDLKKAWFPKTKGTRPNISFAEADQNMVLRLKQGKTDTEHTGVQLCLRRRARELGLLQL